MPYKGILLLVVVAAAFGIGFWAGHAAGFKEKDAEVEESSKSGHLTVPVPPGSLFDGQTILQPGETLGPPPVAHHYEFKQNGASIYRFDSDTGESCWVQLSEADRHSPMPRCPQ